MAERQAAKPFFSLVEFRDAKVFHPCRLCGEQTQIEVQKFRGAIHYRPDHYCVGHAIGIKQHFLLSGTIVRMIDSRKMSAGSKLVKS